LSRPAWQRRLILAAKIALAVGLLAWLGLSGRLEWGRLASVSLDWQFGLLMALVAGSMIIPAFRWWWLLRVQGLNEPLGKIMWLTWAGYFAALLLPGTASGDIAKGYLILRRRSDGRARAFSTVLADRFLGMQSLFFLGAVAAIARAWRGDAGAAGWTMAAVVVMALAAMTAGLAALLFEPARRRIFAVLPEAWRVAWNQSFASYRAGLPQLAGCFAISLVSSAMTVGSLGLAGRMMGEHVTWDQTFLAGPLVVVANCLPLTPGGIGVAESASSELFGRLGAGGGAEMMVLLRLCTALLSLPGVFPVLMPTGPRRTAEDGALPAVDGDPASTAPRELSTIPAT
jgi:uncharacterized membrane protein YbhN (UPF0104 family)